MPQGYSLFFNKVAGLRPKAQVFSCEFCEISNNTFLKNTSGRLLLYFHKKFCHRYGSKYRSSRPNGFCKKSGLTNFGKFTGKNLQQSLLKKTLWHRCFLVGFEKLKPPVADLSIRLWTTKIAFTITIQMAIQHFLSQRSKYSTK